MVKEKVDGAKGTIVADDDARFAFFYNEDNRIVYLKPNLPRQSNYKYKTSYKVHTRNYLAGFLVASLVLSFLYLILRGLGVINGW